MEDLKVLIGKRIKQARLLRGDSQNDLAAKLDNTVSAAAISSYENGGSLPSFYVAYKIAKEYNISLDWLCGLPENREIRTYADMINLIINLEEQYKTDMSLDATATWYELAYAGDDASLIFRDDNLAKLFIEWDKMKKLHDDKTIDDELYMLWVEKKLSENKTHYIQSRNYEDIPF